MTHGDHIAKAPAPEAQKEAHQPPEALRFAEVNQQLGAVPGVPTYSFENPGQIGKVVGAVGQGVEAIAKDVAAGTGRVSNDQVGRYLALNTSVTQGVIEYTSQKNGALRKAQTDLTAFS